MMRLRVSARRSLGRGQSRCNGFSKAGFGQGPLAVSKFDFELTGNAGAAGVPRRLMGSSTSNDPDFSHLVAKEPPVAPDPVFDSGSSRTTRWRISPGVELLGYVDPAVRHVVSREALELVADLTRAFRPRLQQLLARRQQRQTEEFDQGKLPHFLPETAQIREGDWKVAPIPADLQKRQVEITGPPTAKMTINALNSGADVFMADFEDSSAPSWHNTQFGQLAMYDAVRQQLSHEENGKQYQLNDKVATLFVRPRGFHLLEHHLLVDGEPVPASFFDFAVCFFNNAKEQLGRGAGPYFYLPKLESHLEARLWNDVFNRCQDHCEVPRGSIRATVLIETLPAAFEMDEILYELRDHSAGLNCGRWDYIFSYIKRLRAHPQHVLPDRATVTMDKGFLNAYVRRLVATCHRRGAHAMGGMAAQIPIKNDDAANKAALDKVREDKVREVNAGHDGTWVAHPGLVSIAREAFEAVLGADKPNQIDSAAGAAEVTEQELLQVPEGPKTLAGLAQSTSVAVQYLQYWMEGMGCVPLNHLMEDAATAEIARAQVWQWIHHGVTLDSGELVTADLFRSVLDKELAAIAATQGEDRRRSLEQAGALFAEMSTAAEFVEFLTVPAYEVLVGPEQSAAPASDHQDRWDGIRRMYSQVQVDKVRPGLVAEPTFALAGARRLWELMTGPPGTYVHALGCLTGNQAVQMAKAGLKSIYMSGWQVAADNNTGQHTFPDQSLYPVNSVPLVVQRINNALQRYDAIDKLDGGEKNNVDNYYLPIVADAEAGFGGPLNVYELMKNMIEAGAAGVHFEDQLSSAKKCGHLGGKVLIPTNQFVRILTAARLAADVQGAPTALIARTDAQSGALLTSDIDEYDHPFIDFDKGRTSEGFYHIRNGIDLAIHRALAYAPYADLIWCETSNPSVEDARKFRDGVWKHFPGKKLAYNCSPSFHWRKFLSDKEIATFQQDIADLGFTYQFITLASIHSIWKSTFELSHAYARSGMSAYAELQDGEFKLEEKGYSATKHQAEVGTGYYDELSTIISSGQASTLALKGSTEEDQF